MPDDGGEIEDELLRELSRDPKLEKLRVDNGLPKHVKCGCNECAVWRARNWHLIEGLDWNPKEKPKVKPPEPVKTEPVKPKVKEITSADIMRAIDSAAEAFKTVKAVVVPVKDPYNGMADWGPQREDIEDPDYMLAMATAPRTDWASVKLRMKQIKEERRQKRVSPTRLPRAGSGRKTRY